MRRQQTIFFKAIDSQQISQLNSLFETGFALHLLSTEDQRLAISRAIKTKNQEIINLIFAGNTSFLSKNNEGDDALIECVKTDDPHICSILLEYLQKNRPEELSVLLRPDQNGRSPLFLCIERHAPEVMQILINFGAAVHILHIGPQPLLACLCEYRTVKAQMMGRSASASEEKTLIETLHKIKNCAEILISTGAFYHKKDMLLQPREMIADLNIFLKETQTDWLEKQEVYACSELYSLKALCLRYSSEVLSERDHLLLLRKNVMDLLLFSSQHPELAAIFDEIASHYLQACVNQPLQGMLEINAWKHIASQPTLSEQCSAASMRYALDLIQRFLTSKAEFGIGLQVEAANILISKIDDFIKEKYAPSWSWPFIDKDIAFLNPELAAFIASSEIRGFIEGSAAEVHAFSLSKEQAIIYLSRPDLCAIWGQIAFADAILETRQSISHDIDCLKKIYEIKDEADGDSEARIAEESAEIQQLMIKYADTPLPVIYEDIKKLEEKKAEVTYQISAQKNQDLLEVLTRLRTTREQFFSACSKGDIASLLNIIEQIKNDYPAEYHTEIYNHRSRDGFTPLLIATLKGHEQVVGTLLTLGVNSDICSNMGESILSHAFEHPIEKCRALVALFQKHKVNIDSFISNEKKYSSFNWPLLLLVLNSSAGTPESIDQEEKVELLLELGASLDHPTKGYDHPFYAACFAGPEVLKVVLEYMLKNSAVPKNELLKNYEPANKKLFDSCNTYGKPKILALLLEYGANLKSVINYNQLKKIHPLDLACLCGNKEAVNTILSHIQKLPAIEKELLLSYSNKSLLLSIGAGSKEIAQSLLRAGVPVKAPAKDPAYYNLALFMASMKENRDILKLILTYIHLLSDDEQQSLLEAKNKEGLNCMEYCIAQGKTDMAGLIQATLDYMHIDKSVERLSYACSVNNYYLVELILGELQELPFSDSEREDVLNHKDLQGRTPLRIATESGFSQIADLIREFCIQNHIDTEPASKRRRLNSSGS